MKKKIIAILFLILGCLITATQYWRSKDLISQYLYDWTHNQKTINSKYSIDSILLQFETISYKKLDKDYLEVTESDLPKFKKMLQHKNYFVVKGKDIYQYIAGTVRIKDLLPKDHFYKAHVLNFNNSKGLFWLVDKSMLYKLVELQKALKDKGYNEKALYVRNGFRHPSYNQKVGGASQSRHIAGEAIDFRVGDINKDGKAIQEDKDIILELLDQKIIKNFGGIGRYPGSMSVHFDTRGHRARWDAY